MANQNPLNGRFPPQLPQLPNLPGQVQQVQPMAAQATPHPAGSNGGPPVMPPNNNTPPPPPPTNTQSVTEAYIYGNKPYGADGAEAQYNPFKYYNSAERYQAWLKAGRPGKDMWGNQLGADGGLIRYGFNDQAFQRGEPGAQPTFWNGPTQNGLGVNTYYPWGSNGQGLLTNPTNTPPTGRDGDPISTPSWGSYSLPSTYNVNAPSPNQTTTLSDGAVNSPVQPQGTPVQPNPMVSGVAAPKAAGATPMAFGSHPASSGGEGPAIQPPNFGGPPPNVGVPTQQTGTTGNGQPQVYSGNLINPQTIGTYQDYLNSVGPQNEGGGYFTQQQWDSLPWEQRIMNLGGAVRIMPGDPRYNELAQYIHPEPGRAININLGNNPLTTDNNGQPFLNDPGRAVVGQGWWAYSDDNQTAASQDANDRSGLGDGTTWGWTGLGTVLGGGLLANGLGAGSMAGAGGGEFVGPSAANMFDFSTLPAGSVATGGANSLGTGFSLGSAGGAMSSFMQNPIARWGAGQLASYGANQLFGGQSNGGQHPGGNGINWPGLAQGGINLWQDNKQIQDYWKMVQQFMSMGDYNAQYRPGQLERLNQFLMNPESALQDPTYKQMRERAGDDLSRLMNARGMGLSGNELGELTKLRTEMDYKHIKEVEEQLRLAAQMGNPDQMARAGLSNLPFLFQMRANRNAAANGIFSGAAGKALEQLFGSAASAVGNVIKQLIGQGMTDEQVVAEINRQLGPSGYNITDEDNQQLMQDILNSARQDSNNDVPSFFGDPEEASFEDILSWLNGLFGD